MKISLITDDLQKSVSFVNHAISHKTQLPILESILLRVKDRKVILTGTDLEIGIETTVNSDIEEEGTIAIPAKIFSDLVNSLPREKLSLETKDSSLILNSKNTHAVIQTMNADEFPLLYEENGEEVFNIEEEKLKKELSMVSFAASVETTRPALSGILLEKGEKGITFVATDGYRLSLKISSAEIKSNIQNLLKQIIIPVRVCREVSSFQKGNSISLFISPKNNQVLFSEKESLLVGRLIDAEFPKYQKIIPADSSTTVLFDREEMQKAVKTCAIFAKDSANIIKLSFQKEKIVVSAKTPSLGENTVEVEAKLNGEENEIAFNVRYLLDLFSNISENDFAFEMSGPLNAGVFKLQNDPTFLHLIMPIRV